MRVGHLSIAPILVSGILLCAQEPEKPLGDVAREARGQKSNPSKSAKVLTNDDLSSDNSGESGEPITATDDPLAVVNKARDALLRDHAHRCSRQTAGNSGPRPGWTDNRMVEVAGPDRIHITSDQTNPEPSHGEAIYIGKDGYRRTGNGPWERIPPAELAMVGLIQGVLLPDVLKFGYKSGDLRFLRQEDANGTPALLYRYSTQAGDMERTIDIWVGIKDNRPRKTEMYTVTRSSVTAPISWRETTSCTYGLSITIEPPI